MYTQRHTQNVRKCRKEGEKISGSFIFKLALMLISVIITGSRQCQKSHFVPNRICKAGLVFACDVFLRFV